MIKAKATLNVEALESPVYTKSDTYTAYSQNRRLLLPGDQAAQVLQRDRALLTIRVSTSARHIE